MAYVVTEACVDVLDRSCMEECPVDCIYEGGRMMYIQPDECVDCGACEPACPEEAIVYVEDVAPDQAAFIEINAEFFAELGSPGSAQRLGRTGVDHPRVAALPAR